MIKELKKLKCGKVTERIDLSKYTTYKLQGTGAILVEPENKKELLTLLQYIKKNNVPYKILGGGSNLIFAGNYEGILIRLNAFDTLEINDTKIKVGAGYPLVKLALKVSRMGYTGLEFATGIPGTIGGAIYNNAGAYGSDMGYIVESIEVITPDLEIKTLYNRDLDFHYRTSFLKQNRGYVCLQANIVLKKGKKEEIMEIIEDRKRRRLMSQPLEFPSAGSVFRNPKDKDPAGKLIEDLGLKGYQIGGAKVSEKHANFIITDGTAKGQDVIKLIREIQNKVKETYDIDLILEQEIVE